MNEKVMPAFILHRVNTIDQLKEVPKELGVEIDLRASGTNIVLHHDPYCNGEDFAAWLDYYDHDQIILNVKEEGIEKKIAEMLEERGIEKYFFLDVSFPFMIWLSNEGMNRFAVRYSEFESIETVLAMRGRAEYVWVDCFEKMLLTRETYDQINGAGFKTCLVSPELQKHDISNIHEYAEDMNRQKIKVDAICTKNPDVWKKYYPW